MQQKKPVSVLLVPLDWGLGHATRCIPIIRELVRQGAFVTIAASGSQKSLLNQEFPQLEFLDIPGYEIRYKPGFFLKWGLVFNIPAILKQIKRENRWLSEIQQNLRFDAVISDNRYGLFHKNLYSVFITHQLLIQSGSPGTIGRFNPPSPQRRDCESDCFSAALPAAPPKAGLQRRIGQWIDRKILKWNFGMIGKFSVCWVPDQEGDFSLAGKLSHPPVLPSIPLKYIGILSRFKPSEKRIVKNSLLILLSGPEPQRTRFEKILFRQLADYAMKTVLVRGLPGSADPVPFIREEIKIYNHLPSDDLNRLLNESEYIISRSGYSTIMDLVQVKKNAIIVPTPGQTEQEYLGCYLHERKWMYMVPQKNFNLKKSLAAFHKIAWRLPEMSGSSLQNVIKVLLKKLSEGTNGIENIMK